MLKKNKELGFKRSSVVNDVFKTQKPDNENVFLATSNTNFELVAAGHTSKCQPLDVCFNNPFIDVLRNLSEPYITNIVTELTEIDQQRERFDIPSPSRQDMVNWIAKGINYLKNHPDFIENSFRVCGMTTNDLGKVGNDKFLKKIMNFVNKKLVNEDNLVPSASLSYNRKAKKRPWNT